MKPDVLCVPARDLRALFDLEWSVGPAAADTLFGLIARRGVLVPRDDAERDDSVKQVCTYGLVWQQDAVLAYTRGSAHSRPELARLWSIGVGGHVEAADVAADPRRTSLSFVDPGPGPMVMGAVHRELAEEIPGQAFRDVVPMGVIHTDAGAGRFHVGLAYAARLGADYARVNFSDELNHAAFLRPERIAEDLLEPWSAILFRELLAPLAARGREREIVEARARFDEFNESRLARQAKP